MCCDTGNRCVVSVETYQVSGRQAMFGFESRKWSE